MIKFHDVFIVSIPVAILVYNVLYVVVLRGGTTNTNFRGFMIQGRVMADDSPAGTFDDDESAPDYQIRCNQAVSLLLVQCIVISTLI